MEKYVKLSAIAKMAGNKPDSESKMAQNEEEDMSKHGCKCECCGNPCDICEEEDAQHEGGEDPSMEDEE